MTGPRERETVARLIALMRAKRAEGPLCDFDVHAHVIHGREYVVPAREVSDYARAYAEMLIDQYPPTAEHQTMRDIVRFAREKAVPLEPFGMQGQRGDWATCKSHLRRWQRYKRKFPKERYPKGTELT